MDILMMLNVLIQVHGVAFHLFKSPVSFSIVYSFFFMYLAPFLIGLFIDTYFLWSLF